MARLVNPGPGDLSDRLSILALKIHFAEDKGVETTHFQTERTALLTMLRSRTLNGKWFDAYTSLAAVNAAIWHVEDELRGWRTSRGKDALYVGGELEIVKKIAFQIQAWNDRRADLIDQINKDAGEHVGGEKV